jgi:hypothetical protein
MEKVSRSKVQYAPQIERMRDSFVTDFEHNGHPEYRIPQADFENRAALFLRYGETEEGRFKNMMRDLMKTAQLKISFLEGEVIFTKSTAPVPQANKTRAADYRTRIPRPQWQGILDTAMPRIIADLKHRTAPTTSYTHAQFFDLLTFWPSDAMFVELLEIRLGKLGYDIEVLKSVVRLSNRNAGAAKVTKTPKPPIIKMFNAQELFAVLEKTFCQTLEELREMKFAGAYSHVVTLQDHPTDSEKGPQKIFFVDEDMQVVGGRKVDEIELRVGDIVLTNEAGAKQFRKAVRFVNESPRRMCSVRKIKF